MIDTFQLDYNAIKISAIKGRYITNEHIEPLLKKWSPIFRIESVGASVLGKEIKAITIGSGSKKILMWSQMHGNESTTTKAVLDLLSLFVNNESVLTEIRKTFTLVIIPILNPDGADLYTRINANEIDLNRDAQDLSQPESKVLLSIYNVFKPDFCFNLHDQRTIFNVGKAEKPATVSFLSPAFNNERGLSKSREDSMKVIIAMNNMLQQEIAGQVGRYDDGFNANCVGDSFQMKNTPTILFESGHFPEDYQREKTREYIFKAIYTALETIHNDSFSVLDIASYFTIPENGKMYYDIIVKNPSVITNSFKENEDVAILFKETLVENAIQFIPEIVNQGDLSELYAHKVYDLSQELDLNNFKQNKELYILLQ